MNIKPFWPALVASSCAVLISSAALASSHREAPFIAGMPKVDGTDFYMFNSYESGRAGFVTLLANYEPLQDAYGGPNYFTLDPEALYEIHIDNNGDAREDLTFQFRFTNTYKGIAIPTGAPNNVNVAIPLINAGAVDTTAANLNVVETYTVNLVRGNRRSGQRSVVTANDNSSTFTKPADNIGTKSIPNYASYANSYIYNNVKIPGCTVPGSRLFVGQRAEGFVVNLGQVFDLVNLNPVAPRPAAGGGNNVIKDKNITTLALEVPASCITAGGDPVIGAWTTASVRQSRIINPSPQGPANVAGKKGAAIHGGAWTQVSRLGSPLVNEVIIGITDKDKFNASEPKDDVANFGAYVLYPTLPVLVDSLFFGGAGNSVPATPRNDLLAAFVTGITTGPGNTPANFKFTAPATLKTPGEMLRMNTSLGSTPIANQKDLGFLACDLTGFPNGRRPIDDVVDIALTVAEGAITAANKLNLQTCSLNGSGEPVNEGAVVNDGATPDADAYLTVFPYLNTPIAGSP